MTAQPEKIKLKVTQAALNQTALDWPRNMTNIYTAIRGAVDEGSDILALEELALTGYEANDEFQRTDNRRIRASLQDIADYAKALDPNLIISVGHPWRVQLRDMKPPENAFERVQDPLYDRLNLPFNMQSVITNGTVVAMSAKSNLFNNERGYESRYFNEWSAASAERLGGVYGTITLPLAAGGPDIPTGNPIVHVSDGQKGFNLAQAICEMKWVGTKYDGHPHDDSRYETDNFIPSISRYLGTRDGLVLTIANASPPARDKIDKHVHLDALASNYADAVIDTDGLGSSGSTFAQFGHRIVTQDGKVLSYGNRMSFNRVSLTTSLVEINSAPDETAGLAHTSIKHTFDNAASGYQNEIAYKADPKQTWDSPDNPDRHYEEVVRYTAFWLFDYMRKSGSKGIMEALSGGADSAFNSVIVSAMVHLGIDELGAAQFCDELKLPNKDKIVAAEKAGGKDAAIAACMEDMLTCVYMGTNNSSAATRNAAEFLVKGGKDPVTGEKVSGIGGKFVNRNVQDLLDFYGTLYAVENTSRMDKKKKDALMRDVTAYLNMSPHTSTEKQRARKAQQLKEKYPEIDDLIGAADDSVAYENIQARGREVLIMLFANKEGKMAVANPNLDEARNAYATFGGDLHSGTINLNAHLPKAYQLNIMRYLYEKGLQGVMAPVRGFGLVLGNKPSAELMPKDEHGNVVQNDEDALQRSFDQMNRISELMLFERVYEEGTGERRLNAVELFERCQKDTLFKNVSDNELYNMVRLSYSRWTIAQHKIHASPIGPTFGLNIDHQTSFRMPNLHGQSKDELALLGINLMFKWNREAEGGWTQKEYNILERRTWQDEGFVKAFDLGVWSGSEKREYDLARLYTEINDKGWDKVFKPLDQAHPVMVVQASRGGMSP